MPRPIYEVSVEGGFTAVHAARLPAGALEAPHAHEWQVTAVFRSAGLDAGGFVVDFLAVRAALDELAAELGGADLNARIAPDGASAERVAKYLADRLAARLGRSPYCVHVTEAPLCRAAYYPQGA